jgi:hypothetical protein
MVPWQGHRDILIDRYDARVRKIVGGSLVCCCAIFSFKFRLANQLTHTHVSVGNIPGSHTFEWRFFHLLRVVLQGEMDIIDEPPGNTEKGWESEEDQQVRYEAYRSLFNHTLIGDSEHEVRARRSAWVSVATLDRHLHFEQCELSLKASPCCQLHNSVTVTSTSSTRCEL